MAELHRVMTGALPPQPSAAPPRPAGMLGDSPAMLEVFRKECPNTVIGSFTHVPPSQFIRKQQKESN